ncbi:MAG: hypothetical protein M3Z24_10045, partial [Chloroflexota bacterium]|nr:hypothetical protein [Chloroflexota bacterium]
KGNAGVSHAAQSRFASGKQKEPSCQHVNGESLATHEYSCLRRGKGESVPADTHQRKSALA